MAPAAPAWASSRVSPALRDLAAYWRRHYATGRGPAPPYPHGPRLRADSLAGPAANRHSGQRGRRPALRPVTGEGAAQPFPPSVQPGHHGSDWSAHDPGDLAVRVPLDVSQVYRCAEVLWQVTQRAQHLGVSEPVKRLCLSGRSGLSVTVCARVPIVAFLAGCKGWLALLLAVGGDERVGEYLVQPGTQVCSLRELVERGVSLGYCLLDQVL